ncbi:MAG: hypothetical protein K0R15_1210 [Clostridiales bacterium]|jgi:serine/threonine-protein kinase|nr:hypothetical protein [Clostridiales bacterium]
MLLLPGKILGDRYEIIEKIGSGGMSDVYKAKCHKLNRYVAIKVLKDEFSEDLNFVQKFNAEAQSAASLSHINIVNVFDVVQGDGIHYIVMELIEGMTLKEFINQKGPLVMEEAVEIAIQIASGIEHAHKNKIIHRDIKPQNIIISFDGIVKVTDFGIARAASSVTITANATGSVHYISPEQARGGYTDEKSDIYSLGITLFEMLTGKLPYEGDNNVSIALQHIQGEVVKPSDVNPNISQSVESVVMKMIQKKGELRYQNITDVIVDLRRAEKDPNVIVVITKPNLSMDSPTVMISKEEVEQINNQINAKNDRQEIDLPIKDKTSEKPVSLKKEHNNQEPKSTWTEKFVMALAIIFAISIVTGGAIFAVSKINDTRQSKVTEIPGIEGLSLEEATSKLKESNLELGEVTYEFSDTIAKDVVIEQGVEVGTRVAVGVKIKVLVSKGIETFSVPNVVGKKFNEAESLIKDANLTPVIEREYSTDINIGEVIRQYPSQGNLTKDEIVTIVVSNGKEVKNVPVPYLINLTIDNARTALEDLNLNVGKVTYVESDNYEKDRVVSQNIDSGASVVEGSYVDLKVSLGPPKYFTEQILLENIFGDFVLGGMVKLELIQNETASVVFDRYVEIEELPLTVPVEGKSGEGTVKLYINDEYQSKSWSISFGEGE